MVLTHEQFDILVPTMTYQVFEGVACGVLCGNPDSELSLDLQLPYDVGCRC